MKSLIKYYVNQQWEDKLIMKKFYRAECKHCGRRFKSNKLKKIRIEQAETGINLEIDMDNVIQNNYHQEIETSKGKAIIDLKDMALSISCPFCKRSAQYTLRQLVLTDRLD